MSSNFNHLKYNELPKVVRGRGIANYPIAYKGIGAKSIHSGIKSSGP